MTIYKSEMKKSVITEADVDIDILKIMAHPIRLQIINEFIQYNKCNVTQLTKLLKIPQSTVSQHLSKMRGRVLKAEKKGLEKYYYITNLKASQIVGILGL
ncbi:transcriptional regulator [Bacillus cereus]|uniref:Transcriptional regulator n=1 Tax=Bacillus cereus TaxID=1396 RepID=A0A9X6VPP1_BACCE|nr:metalloregulator ArsR/SmtB family transcription factor [Bacillus cereus]PFC14209.1 transcriptional regulator [Bacillus cereus]PFD24626.1 transcriptional regulator [Bacillus cereus]PFL63450.1 transcriptional regulator [Bacillus cereus]